jgi:hypothetical protein
VTSGARTREGRFIEVGCRFPRCSGQFQSVFGVSAVKHWLYLAAKLLEVGPTKCFLVPSLQWMVVPFRGCEAPGLDIQ